MTFNEAYERAHGYAWRIWDTEGKSALHGMLIKLREAHDAEVREARDALPPDLPTYDAAGDDRHRAAWALKNWDDDEIVRESAEDHLYMLYMKLYNELPGDEPHEKLAIAIRDRLIGLLEA